MFRLVEHLCPRLGASGLSVIYDQLRQLPRQYEEMHVRLIRHFAEAASDGGAEKKAVPTGEKRGVVLRFVVALGVSACCRRSQKCMRQGKQP